MGRSAVLHTHQAERAPTGVERCSPASMKSSPGIMQVLSRRHQASCSKGRRLRLPPAPMVRAIQRRARAQCQPSGQAGGVQHDGGEQHAGQCLPDRGAARQFLPVRQAMENGERANDQRCHGAGRAAAWPPAGPAPAATTQSSAPARATPPCTPARAPASNRVAKLAPRAAWHRHGAPSARSTGPRPAWRAGGPSPAAGG